MPQRILIVDDESDLTQLLEFNLRRAGYDVTLEYDGESALASVLARPPDLVVLDVMLPKIDGFSVCEILRRTPSTARLPIILLTACASESARVIGLELGADDYVVKPLSPRELLLRIEKLLTLRAAAKALP